MRYLAPGCAVFLASFALAGSVRADHPLACRGGHCAEGGSGHPLSFLRPHHRSANECEEAKPHCLFSWMKRCLRGHSKDGGHCKDAGHGHGHHHPKLGECGYHPWFQTFRPLPDGAFPMHPFARSPRDFFMYE